MRRVNVGFFCFLAVLAVSCGKKEGDDKSHAAAPGAGQPEPDVVSPTAAPPASSDLSISGVLNLTSLSLTSSEMGVLAFQLSQGKVSGVPEQIDVDADGTFVVPVRSAEESEAKLDEAIAADSLERMKELTKEILPGQEADIDRVTDIEELRAHLVEMKSDAGKESPSYLLIAYEKSGDRVAEAQSFRFIGMPTASGQQLLSMPVDALKGSVALGVVSSASGDEAVSEQAADSSVFSLSETAIEEFASLSDSLKIVRNFWMNADEQGHMPAEITPFFTWQVTSPDAVRDQFTAPSEKPVFTGTGVYLSLRDIGATFDQLCALGGAQERLRFEPPSAVTMEGIATPFSSSNPLTNGGTYTRDAQYNGVACQTDEQGSAYIRNDEPDNGANTNLMVNWGSLQGALPEGLWPLKFGGQTRAQFELASSFPLDAEGFPKVYVPVFKLSTQDNQLVSLDVKFFIYSGGSFREVTDATALEKNIHSLGFDMSYRDNSDRPDMHAGEGQGATFQDGVFSYTFADTEKVAFSGIGAIGFNYLIGNASYRMDYRPPQGN